MYFLTAIDTNNGSFWAYQFGGELTGSRKLLLMVHS